MVSSESSAKEDHNQSELGLVVALPKNSETNHITQLQEKASSQLQHQQSSEMVSGKSSAKEDHNQGELGWVVARPDNLETKLIIP